MLWHCLACGGGNPRGTRFCGHCGTPAEAANRTDRAGDQPAEAGTPVADERRLITALFADVSGFTVLGDTLELDDLHGIIEPLISRLAAVGEGYDGTIAKYAGDALLIFFGAPIAHEDHAERACMAALDMHRELERILPELGPDAGNLQMHIGVNTGHAIAGMFGGQVRSDYSILGDAVNVAQRLEASAKPGETFVGKRTFELTRERFVFDYQGELTLKGKAEPVPAWKLLGERPREHAEPARRRSAAFVGREPELAAAESLLAALGEGRGGGIAITGEPGVGKSTLIHAVRERARAAGIRWLDGRCISYGSAVAYYPFIDLVRSTVGIRIEDAPEDSAQRLAADPAIAATEDGASYLARLLGLPQPEGAKDISELDPEAFRDGVHRTFEAWLRALAADGPAVVAVEDVHWIDASSQRLAEGLASLGRECPIALCLTGRPEGVATARAVLAGAASDEVVDLELGPFAADTVSALVEGLLGGRCPAELVDAVMERTAGNPFFVVEMVRALVDGGALEETDGGWAMRPGWDATAVPDTVEGVLAARIDLLPRTAAGVLQSASVIGRRVLLPILEAVEQDGTDLRRALGQLVEAGMLDRRDGEDDALYFHHALVADVAYARIPGRVRRDLHRRVAAVAEELYGSGDDVIDLLARNLYLAQAGVKAVECLIRAGWRSKDLFANDEAILHLERAAELARLHPRAKGRLPQVLLELADVHELTADFDTALRIYDEVRDTTGDVAAWRGIVATMRRRGDFDEALALLEEAFASRALEGADLTPLWLERAWILVSQGRFLEAIEAAAVGVAAARNPLHPLVGELLMQQARAETAVDRNEDALAHCLQARDLFRNASELRGLTASLRLLGTVHLDLGEIDAAADVLAQGLTLAERTGSVEEIGRCIMNLAIVEFERGSLEEALVYNRRAVEVFERIGHATGLITAYGNLAEKLVPVGELAEAHAYCDRARELATTHGDVFGLAHLGRIRAQILLAEGRGAAAAEEARAAAESFRGMGETTSAATCDALCDEALRLENADRPLEETPSGRPPSHA